MNTYVVYIWNIRYKEIGEYTYSLQLVDRIYTIHFGAKKFALFWKIYNIG